MNLDITFEESNQNIDVVFEEVQQASDGGFERGYEEGFEKGNEHGYTEGYAEAQEEIAPKFGIQNEVKGTNLVTLDYVNENEHNIEVQLSSDTITDFSGVEVVATSTNLFDISKFVSNEHATNNGDGSITLSRYAVNVNNNKISECCPHIKVGQSIVFTATNSGLFIYFGGTVQNKNSAFVVTKEMLDKDTIGFYGNGDTTADNPLTMTEIRINIDKSLPYEHYAEKTYLANADGTVDGVKSIAPIMNIICDGVDISAKYYQRPCAEYDRFWDNFQDNGNRTDYSLGFGGKGWTSETFKPKYDIKPTVASSIFQKIDISCDLVALLNELGIVLDFANCSAGIANAFQESTFTRVGVIDARQCPNINYLFTGCTKLEVVDKIILSDTVTQGVSVAFSSCSKLREIRIEGKVRANLGMLQSSLLSAESIQSIIDALADMTGQTMQTITFHSSIKANLTDEQIEQIMNKKWKIG